MHQIDPDPFETPISLEQLTQFFPVNLKRPLSIARAGPQAYCLHLGVPYLKPHGALLRPHFYVLTP
jgi:hypothetical protein